MQFSPRPDAMAMTGDEIAVTLAAAVLEKIVELLHAGEAMRGWWRRRSPPRSPMP
uniref:Uncharacterized protein n=1 Tax=Phenylobacterium glaciei TaxID=2803784 RepID=A0A974P166_9CAUL|nr:hypothetical protein JKL49_19745 [Phenylobacterium glaciei]